jgi:hypothetical protein
MLAILYKTLTISMIQLELAVVFGTIHVSFDYLFHVLLFDLKKCLLKNPECVLKLK